MKHLKRFNEELSPRIYQDAARKLDMQGRKSKNAEFTKRAEVLRNYAENKKWQKNIKEYAKYGKATVSTKCENGKTISGDFHLIFDFDYFNFQEINDEYMSEDKLSIHFSVGLIPLDVETKDKFKAELPDGDFDNGFFWGMWVGLDFEDKGKGIELDKLSLSNYDESVSGEISFTRPLCGLIKKHLTACFATDSNYSLYNDRNMHDSIEEEVLVKCGVSSHFGITMEDLQDFIKKITPNALMASVSN